VTTARAQVATAILLSLAAGCVDAVSFVVLHRIFTANMTGNTTELGIAAGHTNVNALEPLAVAALVFAVAIALGTAGIELATRRGLRATAAPALAIEAALIAVFMLYGRDVVHGVAVPGYTIGGFYVLLTVAIVAMGIQTAILTRAFGATIRTTYVSGLLTDFSQELVNVIVPVKPGRPSYLRDDLGLGPRRRSLVRLGLHLAVWTSFAGGAVWGGFAEQRWSTWALALPLGAVLAAAAVDLRRLAHSPG
jgi:uncharacterized membrane protein YoaK (UPF0700 family)